MAHKVILIEDEPARGRIFANLANAADIPIVWIHYTDKHGTLAPITQALQTKFLEYIATADQDEAIAAISRHCRNSLVLLDWQLGELNTFGLRAHLKSIIGEQNLNGCTMYLQAYSRQVSEAAVNAEFISPQNRRSGARALTSPTDAAVAAVFNDGLEGWRRCHHEDVSLVGRLWPDTAMEYFGLRDSAVPHAFESRVPSRYRAEVAAYLQHLLLRAPPPAWLDDEEQAAHLHNALITLVGDRSAAHAGHLLASGGQRAGSTVPRSVKSLKLSAVVLLLAAATAPENDWIDTFRWQRSVDLTPPQTPAQARMTALSLANDGEGVGEGLFYGLGTLEAAAHWTTAERTANRGAVEWVRLEDPGTLRIGLAFDMTRPREGRTFSLAQLLRYEGGEPGGFLYALGVAVDALSRSKDGIEQTCRVGLVPAEAGLGTELVLTVA